VCVVNYSCRQDAIHDYKVVVNHAMVRYIHVQGNGVNNTQCPLKTCDNTFVHNYAKYLLILICFTNRLKAKFRYASWSQTGSKLVVDRSEAGRRPVASWNLAYHLAR